MSLSSINSTNNLSLSSFLIPQALKPQVRWVPQIAGQVARVGTLAALGYTGYQAYANGVHSFADAGMLQNALFVVSPVVVANIFKSSAESLTTRALWNPIQKEKLNDADQVLNKGVLNSTATQESLQKDFPGSMDKWDAYMAGIKKQALMGGLLYAGVGTALAVYYLNQFGG